MNGIVQILQAGSMLALLLVPMAGCKSVKQVENRGYIASKPLEEEIRVGKTSREDVRRVFGSPSTISAYPPETWYYISRERETIGFFAPELKKQQVARIEFDEEGRVSHYEAFDKHAVREMDYVERKTPTEGRSLGFAEQLLGNVGRFNTPRDATEARQ